MREEVRSISVQKKSNGIQKYESCDKRDFIVKEDIVGLDANVLVDMVESEEFKNDLRQQVNIGILRIFTTNVAVDETKHVLIRYRNYDKTRAIKGIDTILDEFSISIINHNQEGNELGGEWFEVVKSKMYIKKIGTFLSDCRILANLFKQACVNLFITEDQNIEEAVKILGVSVRVRITGEASNISGYEVKRFFKQQRKDLHKSKKR